MTVRGPESPTTAGGAEHGWRSFVVAFGSNLGERHSTITDAVDELSAVDGISITALSPIIETIAVTLSGPDPTAPLYLNAVARGLTTLSPEELLAQAHRVENLFGRVRDIRWGDRTLDIDIITIDGVVRDSAELTLPHPRAAERDFVLNPWFEIEPEAVLPGHGPIRTLRAALDHGQSAE
ncbi:MAG: 2-amino-4-hydroxy-6-hydroxymethyldihydropteridine diphosphokinase, partial [Mycetocola sp.]